jgi:hypothetical protein
LDGVGDGVVNVLGQQFSVAGLGLDQQALILQVGKLVYIEASLTDAVLTATAVETFDTFAVPGTTSVFVQGPVSSIDSSVGRISVGSLEIDVNSVRGLSPEIGQLITIVGTQPVPQGLILGSARQ